MIEFVRPAVESDIAELLRLDAEYRSGFAPGVRGGQQWLDEHPLPTATEWARRLADPQWRVLVAGVDEAVLGMLSLHLGRSVGGGALVDQVFVADGAREIGLGDGLVAAALDAARSAGATAVEALALPGDRETKNLFERAGLVARLIVVRRELGA